MKRTASKNPRGFSTVQMVITLAVISIVTGFAVVSITRARDHVRLMNSARQFAGYVERARADAVRRHATATVQTVDNDTYAVTMDWDGFGTTRTQNFNLEQGVVFTTGQKNVTFNWRGRIASEESFGFSNGRNTVSVGVTGSGDVTFDAQIFHDASLPPVALNGPGGSVIPDPAPGGEGLPAPSPSPGTSPTPAQGPSPTPTPTPQASPTPTPSPIATPFPTPESSPSPGTSPTPSGTPGACTIVASPTSLTIVADGSSTLTVNLSNAPSSGVITATSSNPGHIQVSPASRTVTGSASVTFTVTVKKQSGSVTFSASGCGSTTVPVTIQ